MTRKELENALSLASGQAPVAPLRLIWELGLLPYTAIARTLPDRHLIIVSHHAASYLPASSNLSPRRYRWGHSQGSEAAAFPSYDATTDIQNGNLWHGKYCAVLLYVPIEARTFLGGLSRNSPR